MLRGETVALRCARLIAGQAQVGSDERGVSEPGRRLDSAAAARPWSRRRRARLLLVYECAELLVGEVVDGLRSLGFAHDALRHQLLERADGFLVAASARMPQCVQVEGQPIAAAAPST